MAHWRDGGIGNMAGSDDRPIKEWTLLEKLAEIAGTKPGSSMPQCLGGPNVINWAEPMNMIAQEAFDEIQRLRGGYPADLADPVAALRERAAGYETLLKEPQWSPMRSHIEPDIDMLRGAAAEIERLRDPHPVEIDWMPMDTAPVEPAHTVPSYYRFRCMLQDARGEVFEGAGYYVKLGRATTHQTLRWQNAARRQVFPKFWKPLPAPEKPETGGAA
jgi:hypothetical protein